MIIFFTFIQLISWNMIVKKISSKKEGNKAYINITTDMNKRLNNDYKNYEKKFINMIELLKNIKNKIN